MDIKSWKDYLLQVSLIIVSLFIAFGVNRCNESAKDRNKLAVYRSAIAQELQQEITTTKSNLADGNGDLEDLDTALTSLRSRDPAQLPALVEAVGTVLQRGVFRGFAPTVYEQMTAAGDLLLIDDLSERSDLAALTAFRRDYVQTDLRRHDEITLEVTEKTAAYANLFCLRDAAPAEMSACVPDLERVYEQLPIDLALLHRHVELRLFHLGNYLGMLQQIQTRY